MHQVPLIIEGTKFKTARKPNLRGITLGPCKFLNNFKYGAFATVNISEIENNVDISSFDDRLAQELGAKDLEDYLAQNWNTEYTTRKIITWDSVDPNWETLHKLGVKF